MGRLIRGDIDSPTYPTRDTWTANLPGGPFKERTPEVFDGTVLEDEMKKIRSSKAGTAKPAIKITEPDVVKPFCPDHEVEMLSRAGGHYVCAVKTCKKKARRKEEAAPAVLGDLDIRAKATLDKWAPVEIPTGNPTTLSIVEKRDNRGPRYYLEDTTTGSQIDITDCMKVYVRIPSTRVGNVDAISIKLEF